MVNQIVDPKDFLCTLSKAEKKLQWALKQSLTSTNTNTQTNTNPITTITFPKGTITFDLVSPKTQNLPSQDCQAIFGAALRYHRDLGVTYDRFCKNWEVTTFQEQGVLTQIYACPKRVPMEVRRKWKDRMTKINIQNAWLDT
jgi:hypothetical protein